MEINLSKDVLTPSSGHSQSNLSFIHIFYRQGNKHSLRNGDRSVWDDWTPDVHPGSWNGPWHGSPGFRKRPNNARTQPQLSGVRYFLVPDIDFLSMFSFSTHINFISVCRNLYPKFASPWASAPCRPQDIGTGSFDLTCRDDQFI